LNLKHEFSFLPLPLKLKKDMNKILSSTFILISLGLVQSMAQTFTALSSGCNNKVYAITGDISVGNTIYAAGVFDHAGGNWAAHVAKWNGSAWSTLDSGTNYTVRSLVYFNSQLYAGGGFNTVGSAANSLTAWGVAKWNGSTWSNLANGIRGAGDAVYALAVYQGELYAGGFFDTLTSLNVGRGIEKWNGSAWVPLGGVVGNGVAGAPGFRVRAMIVFNSKLYVGGTFTTAGGITVNNIATWDGTSWSAVGVGTNNDVNAFTIHNGNLYVGGAFTVATAVSVNHLAKITGNTFNAVGNGVDGVVYGLGSYQNNLFVTGNFMTSGGSVVTTQNISRWDGVAWHALTPSIPGIDGEGYCLTTFSGDLYIGGFFAVAGTVVGANSIVKWNMPPLGIEETNANSNNLNVFPNPSSGKFKLQLTESGGPQYFDMLVTDISGRLIYQEHFKNISAFTDKEIDITGINKGIYFLKLVNDKSSACEKLIIE
jgi:hypothetical protein